MSQFQHFSRYVLVIAGLQGTQQFRETVYNPNMNHPAYTGMLSHDLIRLICVKYLIVYINCGPSIRVILKGEISRCLNKE